MKSKILKSTALFSGFILFAQVLGLVRDLYLTRVFGVGQILDVYYFAFKIPDFLSVLYSVFLGSVIFIPLLTKARFAKNSDGTQNEDNKKEMTKIVSSVGSFVLCMLSIFFIIVLIFMSQIVNFMVPTWSLEQRNLLIDLSRILIVAQFFFPIGILGGSLGMVYNKTFGLAASAFVYNAVILLGAILLAPIYGIYGVVYSVLFAAICFMLVQIYPKVVREILFKFKFKINFKDWLNFAKENYLRFVAVLSYQVYGVVLLYYAAQTGVGGASIFSLSYNIFLAMFFVISATFSQVLMPYFSENHVKDEKEILKTNFKWAMKFIFVFSLLVSIVCALFSWLIVEILFYFSALDLAEKLTITQMFIIFLSSFAFFSVLELMKKYFYSTNQIFLSFLLTLGLLSVVVILFNLLSIYFGALVNTKLYFLAIAISVSIIVNTIGFVIYLKVKKEI